MTNSQRQIAPSMLPFESDGHLLELLWLGLGIVTAWSLRGRRQGGGAHQATAADLVHRLSPIELRTLLSVLEEHMQDVQRDIASVQAALHAAA